MALLLKIEQAIIKAIKGHEAAYCDPVQLAKEFHKLVQYAVDNRDERPVDEGDFAASALISETICSLGYYSDINIGRDLWELVSEDAQALWLYPPENRNQLIISLVNVAQNMATSQCYIEF